LIEYILIIILIKDKSGKVDFYEFLIAISLSSDKDPKTKLRFAFKMYDIDQNKMLDINEIENIIKAINKFSGLRENKSNNQPTPHEIAKHLLKKFDRDSNGFLTEEEFIDEALTFPTLHALNSFSVLRDGFIKK
jgi:Ca2+-binding EF-hand superfamily protein